MKRTLIAIMASLYGHFEMNAQHIEFESETIDYGTIKMGSNGERIFKFKNTGDKPLVLSDVYASCGCTVPTWSTNPILPKKWGKIKVVYDTERIGPFKKSITVLSNTKKKRKRVIYIEGEVTH